MKKIPTLFKREYENHRVVACLPEVTEGMEWVIDGEGTATVKYDGSCCAIICGELYKRYDAKKGKPVPNGAIKCQEEADKITGHLPCWVKCDENNPADKWFFEAYKNTVFMDVPKVFIPENAGEMLYDELQKIPVTFEAIGKHFNGNPYNLGADTMIPHGLKRIEVERTFEGIREYLRINEIEGIVFWKDGEPKCKIKRSDFGFPWGR